ncbi:hypothetical protein RV11_GL003505 [Enterococcus phoeniculicola]|uniref:hypothetical protein n=1 Tax=Enterococcus phoeniculicola TaxID=154621 RepID=UPI0003A2E4AE|nr:hypothetical protein [Enterococcus phoeniculicola]OJG71784.1 hypothetical protein RV11_GL003505 [Enterococcus phoeniculicola]
MSPKTSTAVAGTAGTRQLNAIVTPENATNKNVSFEINPVTEGLSVTNNGLISWTEDVAPGTYITTVKSSDGAFTDSNTLTLTE